MAIESGQKTVEFKDKKLRKFLSDVIKNSKKINQQAKNVGIAMSSHVFKDVIKHFREERGPDGKWDAWSPSYQRAINSENPPRKPGLILQATTRMRQSFTPEKFEATKEGFLWFNPAKTKAGFPYAYAHDNDEEERTRLPQRSFMWISNEAQDNLMKELFHLMGIK